MTDGVDALLDRLIAKGATKVSFHDSGALASVEFGPTTSAKDEPQPDQPKDPMKRRSAVGGLVPRGEPSD